ncbi:MAG TPA: hypothetical protein VFU63_12360 [Ktedonobacterales bacterium]|nr:hypothetical protein [Ktedonobacterales bacterium]
MGVVGHLLGGLRRAVGRVVLWFIIFGLIGAAVVEIVAFIETGGDAPGLFTNIIAVIMGIVFGYAAGLTVVVGEVIRFMVEAIHEAEKGIEGDLSTLGSVAKAIEKHL